MLGAKLRGYVRNRSKHRKPLAIAMAAALLSAAVAALAGGLSASAASAAPSQNCPWLYSHATPEAKAAQVMSAMTLDQKLGMIWPSASSNLGTNTGVYQQETTAIPALCVPSLTLQAGDGGIGKTTAGTATQLPSPIAVGASFDTGIANLYGSVEGQEAKVKGIDGLQAPFVNIDRVPQAGRDAESYGEDPYLVSSLAVADVRGMTSSGVMSVVQSFTAYNQETNRDTPLDDVIVSDRALHEVYMQPEQDLVQDNLVGGIMCAYPVINGAYSCQSPDLLEQVLGDQWNFQGFVRTDAGALHDYVQGFNAGVDFSNPIDIPTIEAAIADGSLPIARLNNAVERILTAMFEYGVFNNQTLGNVEADAVTPAHVAAARTIAEAGTVLLQNTGNLLPLDPGRVGSVAVIGSDGGSGAVTSEIGSGSVPAPPGGPVTPDQGITALLGSRGTVTYNDGTDIASAAATAAAANVAIVFADYPAGEGTDLSTLDLPDAQDSLIEAVAAANPNTVVVINSGNPVLMPWLSSVKGILEAWYSGQEDGDAIANILFGRVDPSGKLPITFPTSNTASPVGTAAQWPGTGGTVQYSEGLDVGYRGYEADNITPLFPFGFGLSYTTFAFSHLTVTPNATTSEGDVRVTATVTNTGHRTGAEVAQLYLGDPSSTGEPAQQLKGFDKVTLTPGQSTQVTLTLTPEELSYWDSSAQTWDVAEGNYQVYVGDSSVSLPLHGGFAIRGTTGSRALTVDAPTQVTAGQAAVVTATLSGGGDLSLNGVNMSLVVPAGWEARPRGHTTSGVVGPSQAVTATWVVTPPADATADMPLLTATVRYETAGAAVTRRSASATIEVVPSS